MCVSLLVEAIVEFDYKAQHDDELTITVGDIITNIKKDDGGWWEGQLKGRRGLFPDNFVRVSTKWNCSCVVCISFMYCALQAKYQPLYHNISYIQNHNIAYTHVLYIPIYCISRMQCSIEAMLQRKDYFLCKDKLKIKEATPTFLSCSVIIFDFVV